MEIINRSGCTCRSRIPRYLAWSELYSRIAWQCGAPACRRFSDLDVEALANNFQMDEETFRLAVEGDTDSGPRAKRPFDLGLQMTREIAREERVRC